VPLAALALVAAGCGDDDDSGDEEGADTTVAEADGIVVGAGISDPDDPNIAVLEFLPEVITVEAGTDVTWEWSGAEPHSVTFVPEGQTPPDIEEDPTATAGAPPTGPIDGTTYVSSALQPLGPTAPAPFEGRFETAGTYSYLCLIHPLMTGTVNVVAAGEGADTPQDVAERRQEETEQWLEEGRDTKAELVDADPVKTTLEDGSTEWTIEMGETTEHVDVLAFAPTPAAVKAGDTVTFVNNSGAPHTATFFGEGADPIQDPFDPRVQAPAPGPSPQALASAGYFNTGWLPPDAAAPGADPPPLEARKYSFTVPEAGTYSYVCMLHAPSQMVGELEAT
jgi:plastocyanin